MSNSNIYSMNITIDKISSGQCIVTENGMVYIAKGCI